MFDLELPGLMDILGESEKTWDVWWTVTSHFLGRLKIPSGCKNPIQGLTKKIFF